MPFQNWKYTVRFTGTRAQADRFIELARHVADWSEALRLEESGEFKGGPEREFTLYGTANDRVPDEMLVRLCEESGCSHVETTRSEQ